MMSTWEEQYWSSIENDQKLKRSQKEIQVILKTQEQRRQLQESLVTAIRAKLKAQYHQAFSLRSSKAFWHPLSQKSVKSKKKEDERETKVQISDELKTLTSLNGFDMVSLPYDPVPLAEGILVRPNFRSYQTQYIRQQKLPVLWVQKQPLPSSPSNGKVSELVQEDVKLYRILENQVEQYLNTIYRRLVEIFSFGRQQQKQRDQDVYSMNSLDDAGESETTNSESLLLIDENEIVYIHTMDDPSLRLLALTNHHSYGHKAASTAISVSFVVFGAIPLAYRSLHFALSYPGMSQMIAASVLVTVSYGIWSTRSIAVTRQSHAISNGIAHRIYARNDAVLWTLQEGAVQRVTSGVFALYDHHLQRNKGSNLTIRPKLLKTSADIWSLARDIGLIVETSSENSDKVDAISLDDAVSLLSKTTNNE
jgi:hypothetical protein